MKTKSFAVILFLGYGSIGGNNAYGSGNTNNNSNVSNIKYTFDESKELLNNKYIPLVNWEESGINDRIVYDYEILTNGDIYQINHVLPDPDDSSDNGLYSIVVEIVGDDRPDANRKTTRSSYNDVFYVPGFYKFHYENLGGFEAGNVVVAVEPTNENEENSDPVVKSFGANCFRVVECCKYKFVVENNYGFGNIVRFANVIKFSNPDGRVNGV